MGGSPRAALLTPISPLYCTGREGERDREILTLTEHHSPPLFISILGEEEPLCQ